jgi:hypothetical protein
MATALVSSGPTSFGLKNEPEFILPAAVFSLADQTAASAAQDAGQTLTWFRALIYVKTYVVGTATVGALFEIEVDTASGMATALESVSRITLANTASSTKVQTALLIGRVAAVLKRYVRIQVTLGGSATISYDAHIDAV